MRCPLLALLPTLLACSENPTGPEHVVVGTYHLDHFEHGETRGADLTPDSFLVLEILPDGRANARGMLRTKRLLFLGSAEGPWVAEGTWQAVGAGLHLTMQPAEWPARFPWLREGDALSFGYTDADGVRMYVRLRREAPARTISP